VHPVWLLRAALSDVRDQDGVGLRWTHPDGNRGQVEAPG